jgi:uncharacterized protein YebE (UPF0316 family)
MLELIAIFSAKVAEVSLNTLRLMFLSKGEKIYAAIIGFVEVLIWLKVASVVIVGINEYPTRMVAYALGYSIGIIVGMKIEEKIGLGYSNLQIITNETDGDILADEIRKLGKAVTVIKGEGRDSEKVILSTYVKRKNKNQVLDKVRELKTQGVVTVSETQKVYGGFGIK